MMSQPLRDVMLRWATRLRPSRRRLSRLGLRPSVIRIVPGVVPMEERLAPAALIAPEVSFISVIPGQTSGTLVGIPGGENQQADFAAPIVAANPLNPNQQVLISQARRVGDSALRLSARFTTDAGLNWSNIGDFGGAMRDHSGADAGVVFTNASQPSITFGRDGIVYVAYLQHTTNRSAGAIVVESFLFGAGGPTIRPNVQSLPGFNTFVNGGTINQNVIYRWSNTQDAALNPVIAVDNNLATYTDADTGATIRDTLVNANTGRPKAIYLAWNVFGTAPTAPDKSRIDNNSRFNVNAIFASVSTDLGANFSAPLPVNGNSLAFTNTGIMLAPNAGYFAENNDKSATASPGGSQPVIAFSPATSSGPGRVVIGWVGTSAAAGQSKAYFDITRPDSGNASQEVAQIKTYGKSFAPGAQKISEPIVDDTNGDPSKVTTTTFSISAGDLAAWNVNDRVTNLTTTIALSHPRMQHLEAKLISPTGTSVTLFSNRTDNKGTDAPAPPSPTLTQPFGRGRGFEASATNGANTPFNGLGRKNDIVYGTTFDDYASRRITDPLNSYPLIGNYKAESWADSTAFNGGFYTGVGALSKFVGLTAAQVLGDWTLEIRDFRNDRITDGALIQPQFLSYFGINITSAQTQQGVVPGFATEQQLNARPLSSGGLLDPFDNPNQDTASNGTAGLAHGLSIAFDTSIQPFNDGSPLFSRPTGQLYVAYTKDFFAFAPDTTPDYDVYLSRATLGGAANTLAWQAPVRVNDDALRDNFSEGDRQQFLPTVAVDPATGYVGVSWYDARNDASKTRVATYFALSSDGGETFSQSPDSGRTIGEQIYLNPSRLGINAIDWAATAQNVDRSVVIIEPIPSIVSPIPGALGLGLRQSLVAIAPGMFNAYWTGNLNDKNTKQSVLAANPDMAAPGGNIFMTRVTAAAGPRIVEGSMGPVPGNTLSNFLITFDRPVDVASFTKADVTVVFRSVNSALSVPGTVLPLTSVVAVNPGGVNGRAASVFRVNLAAPQTGVGTYSYFVGSQINDLVRTVAPNTAVPFVNDVTVVGTFSGAGGPVNKATTQTTPVFVVTPTTTFFPITVPFQPSGLLVGLPRVTVTNLNTAPLTTLRVTLIAPTGTRLVLLDNPANGGTLVNTTFVDATDVPPGAAQGFGDLTAALTLPDAGQTFTGLRGTSIEGTWVLEIVNSSATTNGTLGSWELNFATVRRNFIVTNGNLSDQNNDGVAGSDGTINPAITDVFAVPGPDTRLGNTTPGLFPYNSLTLPLIITGPKFTAASVFGRPFSSDNLVLNTSASNIDVTFDRPINGATFEADGRDVLRINGPTGVIFDKNEWDFNRPGTPYPVSVAQLSPTSFRVSFPTQVLGGAYNIEFSSDISDTLGNKLDNNQNAGLSILRGGGDPTTGSVQSNTYNNDPGTVSILSGQTVSMPLTITDLFTIEQTLASRIQLQINVTHPNVPDLEADLIAPDGTTIRLFARVGTAGTNRANFTNTLFDDGGQTTIQAGLAPFNTGPYTPQFPLSALRGRPTRVLDINGNPIPWRLQIRNVGSQSGTIQSYALTLPFVVPGTGLGESIADRFSAPFRIFTQDATNPLTKQTWTPFGPAPTNAQDNVSRITGLAVDPSDPSGNTVYAGGASGGIFKSTNFLTANAAGPNWIPLTDFGPTWNLNTGSIAVFPRNGDPNQSIVFVLTGEGDTGTPGVGVLRSMDGGRTWVVLAGLTNSDATGNILPIDSSSRSHEFVGTAGFKIVVDPTLTPSGEVIVYMAVSRANGGIYRSVNTGRTWQLVRGGQATSVHLSQGSRSTSSFSSGALEFLYAAFQGEGVFTTSQATSTNSLSPTTGIPGVPLIRDTAFTPDIAVPVNAPVGTPNGAKGRISISGPASTGDVLQDTFYAGWLYAIVATPIGGTDGLYLTKDFGRNWVQVQFPVHIPDPTMKSIGYPTNNETRNNQELFAPPSLPNGQGNYNQDIVVDPSDPEIVYVAGLGNGNGVPMPAGGLIRVDVSAINDSQAFNNFDNSSGSSAGAQSTTQGGLTNPGSIVGFAVNNLNASNTFNLSRNPNSPFDANSSVKVASASKANPIAFTNTGENATYSGFTDLLNSADLHRLIAFRDQQSGKTRIIGSGDHQVFTGVDDGTGVMLRNIGFANSINGTRNGNLQLLQAYSGAVQPSQLAIDIAQAFIYGMAQDNGFPVSGPNVLSQGDIGWTGPRGDGAGVSVDPTGGGTAYQYRWPCCQGGPGLATDFFRVIAPPGPGGSAGVSRTSGLIQPGDDPASDKGQWPQIADVGYFTVNPVDPNGIVISSNFGRIFRTTNQGKDWFPIAEPTVTKNSYARATAFGAPDPANPGLLNNFIYVGTSAGQVLVTNNGGGSWRDISQGIAGNGPIMQIITSPQRGSRSAYAVTPGGVFFLADSNIGTWVEITGNGTNPLSGNLFTLRDPIFGDRNDNVSNPVPNSFLPFTVRDLFTIQADYRYAIPFDPSNASKGTFPVLYVGGTGGVFRSLNNGTTWQAFPGSAALVDPVTGNPILDPVTGQPLSTANGGNIPNAQVRDLDLALGNIDPLTGFPRQSSGGLNLLVASTYGRGMWGIRLEVPASVEQFNVLFQSGPRVAGLAADSKGSFLLRFDAAVDPTTFDASDITIVDSAGNPLTISSVSSATNLVNNVDQRNLFRVVFANTKNADVYNVVVGPEVFDFAGFGMNQNRDKINGDKTFSAVTGAAIDAYYGQFRTVNSLAQTGNLFVDVPYNTRAGEPSTLTVSAVGIDGLAVANYSGTVTFASTDSKISIGDGLPNNYQFGPLDRGTRSFPVFFRTATFNPALAPIVVSVTDTAAVNPLGGALGKTEVRGGDAKTFAVSGIASPTPAGALNDVVISALDQFGNTADAFTGEVTFSSSDPLVSAGDGLPINVSFLAADFGKATVVGQVSLRTAGSQFVGVTDKVSGLVFGQQSNIIVLPDVAKSLTLFNHSTPIVAGTKSDFSLLARDKYGNIAEGYLGTVTFTSSDAQVIPGDGLPANYTFMANDKGQKLFTLGTQLKTAGVQFVQATDTTTASITGRQPSIQVVPAAAAQFTVTGHPATTVAGTQNTFTVFASDPFGNRASNYTGTVGFSSSDPLVGSGSGLPNAYSFTSADAGQKVFTKLATLRTAGTQSISATDATNNFTGTQGGITVTSAVGTKLALTNYPNPTTAGKGNNFLLTAQDVFGNTADTYRGTVRISTTDVAVSIGNGLPQNITFTANDQGKRTVAATELRTAGLQTITATDVATSAIVGSQSGILVLPDVASILTLAGFPSPTAAGTAGNFKVTARDRFGNLATTYQGTVFFASSDILVAANKGLPTNATFMPADKGQRTFAATLKTAGTQSISATDIVNPGVNGTQSGIQITAAALSRLTVGGFPSPVVAGLSTGLTVAASDQFGNPISNFTGTVGFTTSDSTGQLPANYTFTAADQGRKSFSAGFILKQAGTQSISATVVGNAGLAGTQSNISVIAAPATKFVVSNFPDPIQAGVPLTFTVTAQDPFDNIADNYNGIANVTTSDPRANVVGPVTLVNGIGTGSLTFRTAGTQTVVVTDASDTGLTGTSPALAVAAAPPDAPDPDTRTPLTLPTLTAVGTDAGIPAQVTVLNADGSVRNVLSPYDASFTGGVRAAVVRTPFAANPRVAVAPGAGRINEVLLFDLKTGQQVARYQPFEDAFTGGVFITSGDINNDGFDDIVASPDFGGGPRVVVFDGKTGNRLADFFGIDDTAFRGGARATMTDLNGDGTNDLVVAAGIGGGPRIAIYDGKTVNIATARPTSLAADFFAFEPALRNGAFVAGGDFNGDGFGDLAFGAGPGGGPRIRVINGELLVRASPFANLDDLDPQVQFANYFAGNVEGRGGIRVTARNLDGDNRADLVVGDGPSTDVFANATSKATAYTGTEILTRVNPAILWEHEQALGFGGGVFVG